MLARPCQQLEGGMMDLRRARPPHYPPSIYLGWGWGSTQRTQPSQLLLFFRSQRRCQPSPLSLHSLKEPFSQEVVVAPSADTYLRNSQATWSFLVSSDCSLQWTEFLLVYPHHKPGIKSIPRVDEWLPCQEIDAFLQAPACPFTALTLCSYSRHKLTGTHPTLHNGAHLFPG